jgi:ankyrin repeat protein
VELGLGIELRGWEDHRPLHAAAWRGDALTVDTLVDLGADVMARARTRLATPLGWAIHGSLHGPPGDHLAVARRLIAAGAPVDPREADEASDALADYLRSVLT